MVQSRHIYRSDSELYFLRLTVSVSPCSSWIASMNRHIVGFVQDSRERKPLCHPSVMFDDIGKP